MTTLDVPTPADEVTPLVPVATALVWAVRLRNPQDVEEAIDQATTLAGQRGLQALVVLLAAMVPDDETPSQLLGWLDSPEAYLRLREQGMSRRDAINTVRQNTGT